MTGELSRMNITACTEVAIIGGHRYPCHGHEDGVHHFAADLLDPCPAPWCRLPAGHRYLHDIPSGRPVFAARTCSHDEPVDIAAIVRGTGEADEREARSG